MNRPPRTVLSSSGQNHDYLPDDASSKGFRANWTLPAECPNISLSGSLFRFRSEEGQGYASILDVAAADYKTSSHILQVFLHCPCAHLEHNQQLVIACPHDCEC